MRSIKQLVNERQWLVLPNLEEEKPLLSPSICINSWEGSLHREKKGGCICDQMYRANLFLSMAVRCGMVW